MEWRHIQASLESLRKQGIRWKTFVLYNGGDFHDIAILGLVDEHQFGDVVVFPYDPATPKSVEADWGIQMREIDGHEKYLCHKADFYLPTGTLKRFERIELEGPWLALFNKVDLKEWVTPLQTEILASMTWGDIVHHDQIGTYSSPRGHLGVRFAQGAEGVDGTMHGYSDGARELYRPGDATAWGPSHGIQQLYGSVQTVPDFWAAHMWHHVPQKTDAIKNVEGDRF